MKRFLKKIKNYIGKNIFKLIIKLKFFILLPEFVKIFPKEKYRASFQLLKRGYLDLAYNIIKNYNPKNNEIHLKQRIEFMHLVKNNGLEIERIVKRPIKNISVLFIVHNSLPYDSSGYAIRTNYIAKYLKKNNIKIVVATRPGYPQDLQKHKNIYIESDEEVINDILYIRLKDKEKKFKKGPDIEYINLYANELVKISERFNITILHAHSNYLNGLAAIKAGNFLKIPVIYEVRGLWYKTRLTLDKKYKYRGEYQYEEEMEKAAIKYADKVVVISESLKKLLIKWGINKEKIYLIPNAIDVNYFYPLKKDQNLIKKYNLSNKIIIGFIGSITAYEGLKELILAFKKISKSKPNVVLMIVGEGRELSNLKKLAKKSKNIIFTGKVPFNEVKKYYSLFDICPFPRNNFEVCRYVPPLKILEAMAMKKAIIVSNVPPLLEIIKDQENGLVCEADSVKDLAKKLLLLIEDNEIRNKLANNAYEWVIKNRSWDVIFKRYIDLYNTFVKNDEDSSDF